MRSLDYTVFFSYLALTLAVGGLFASRQRRLSDYLLAGRSMRWFPIGISIMVTAFSAINYTAFSGEVYQHGLYVMLCLPVFLFVALPVTRLVMPLYHGMGVTSAYEYLERRFDSRVRRLASGLFVLWRLLWMATVLYVPCRVLALITGIDLAALVVLAGAVATAYTLAGGMRAVMWTDVLQFAVLLSGAIFGLAAAAARQPGGLEGIVRLGLADGLGRPLQPFDASILSPDPFIRITVWSCWLGTTVAFLARYGADQVVVQRYFTARSLQQARRGFHLSYVSAIASLLLLGLLGFAIHAHARAAGLGAAPPMAAFASFVRSLPAGTTGLLVAALFAATMSSLDSGINSCSASLLTDLLPRRWSADDRIGLRAARLATLGFGALATTAALQVGRLGSVFEIANRVINGMGSPLLALFLVGLFSRRVTPRAALAGGALGAAASAVVSFCVDGLALHYYAVINLSLTAALCYLLGLVDARLTAGSSAAQLAWTWRQRRLQAGDGDRREPDAKE